MDKNKELTISILSKSYSIVTDEDSELVEKAAQHVDSLLKNMVGSATSPSDMVKKTTFVALLVAVELLKRRYELERKHQELEAMRYKLEAKTHELQSVVEKTAILNDLLKESLA